MYLFSERSTCKQVSANGIYLLPMWSKSLRSNGLHAPYRANARRGFGINVALPRYSGTMITIIYVYGTPVYVVPSASEFTAFSPHRINGFAKIYRPPRFSQIESLSSSSYGCSISLDGARKIHRYILQSYVNHLAKWL